MAGQPPNAELQEALLELQQYLSDSLPPLVVADAVTVLMKYPAQAVIPTIRAWTAGQYRGGSGVGVPISDYLFHALKKIHMMGEFNLVPLEALNAYLVGLKAAVVAVCPADDQAILTESLARMGEGAQTSTVSPVTQIHRQAAPETAATASAASRRVASEASGESATTAGEALTGLKRVGLLLERLEAQGGLSLQGGAPRGGGGGGVAAAGSPAAASETLAFAARHSQSREELEKTLARLKALGFETGTEDVFKALSQTVPGWVAPLPAPDAVEPAYEAGAIGAMRRIITEAEDPVEASRRFHEMVRAGVDRFNEGSLPQAVQMLELARRLVSEKKVDAGSAEIASLKLGETLDWERLKKFAETGDQGLVRRVLQFFTALQPEGLLDSIIAEPKRDRRRLVLLLLEIHGAPAREQAFERLTRSIGPHVGEEEWFFRRNLLYLLRRIPRNAESPPLEAEIDVILHHARLGVPLVVIKEAIAALGQLRDDKAEVGLAQLLADVETMLIKPPEKAVYEAKDLRALLDRIAATLARMPSRTARHTLLAHVARKALPLGDTMGRLSELGAQSLADDPETVAQLIEMIKGNLPFKVLGVTLRQNDHALVRLIEALAATPAPVVRHALEDIVARFPENEAARASSRAIAGWDRPAAPAEGSRGTAPAAPGSAAAADSPAASLQGDLEVFGLPALLQSLADSSSSGALTLREPGGGPVFAQLTIRDGKLEEIKRGRLSGEDAFYQLLERPIPGQFVFVKGIPPAAPGAASRAILPLTLEAMRRYDELQQAMALVPDAAFLESTGKTPTPQPWEKDGGFLQALWSRASRGGTPEDCEAAVSADSYRVRRLLTHWVEEGSLKLRS